MSQADAHKALIERFYTAFNEGDFATMQASYHADIVFEDPAFGVLRGANAGDMWQMLLSTPRVQPDGSRSLTVVVSDVTADETHGSANWVATYKYQGRPVVNRIQASFEFRDGLIVKHTDVFDFWAWSAQALGLTGHLLGWTAFLRAKVNVQATGRLTNFIKTKYAAELNPPAAAAKNRK